MITLLYVDDHKIMLFVNNVLSFTILNHLQGRYYGILASLDGVFVILCLSVYMDSLGHFIFG